MNDDLVEALRLQVITLSEQANYQAGRQEMLSTAIATLFGLHPDPRQLAGIVRGCAEARLNGQSPSAPDWQRGVVDQANALLDVLSEPPLD